MVTKTEWMKQKRAERRVLGLCIDCGGSIDVINRSFCTICLAKRRKYGERRKEKNKKYHQELRARRREQGQCRDCGKPAIENLTLCEDCRERQRLYSARSKAKGNKSYNLEKQRAFTKSLRIRRLAIGLCPYCGEALDTLEGLRCKTCREKYREYRKKYYEKHKKSIRKD